MKIARLATHPTDPRVRLLHIHPDLAKAVANTAAVYARDHRAFVIHISDLPSIQDRLEQYDIRLIDETVSLATHTQPPFYDPDEHSEGRPPTAEYQAMREQLRAERAEAKRSNDEPAA